MKKNLILISILSLFLTGCMEKSVVKNDSSSGNNNSTSPDYGDNNGGNSGGDIADPPSGGEDDGISDGGQTQTYYRIEDIVLIGGDDTTPPRYNYYTSGVMWSSSTNISSSDQGIFYTNSRFNVRIKVKSQASRGTTDANGRNCQEAFMPYTKLNVKVCLRSRTGSCVYTHTFEGIQVDQTSYTVQFNVPTSSDPLVLEILNVESDSYCQYYASQGFNNVAGFCPTRKESYTHCTKLDVHFATDYTKNLPGPYY